MTINYTSLLGLAKPVTGTETGQWGDVVNNEITSLLEDAVANAATISVTAGNVTLSTTNGSSNQARMATLIITGTPGTTRNVVAPSQAKIYVVINQSDSAVVIKGAATTGITIASGQTAQIVWNGSDFVEVGSYVHGNLIVNGNLTVKGNTTLGDAAGDSLTVNATVTSNLIFTDNTYDIGASGATRPRTIYAATSIFAPLMDATNLEVTNIKALDGTAAITITSSTGAVDMSTAVTMSATTQNIALGTSQTSGTFTVGGAAQTGTQTFDQSTKTHTLNVGTGATESGLTKTINIGTGGVATSTTAIAIGSTNGTTITLNGTVNATTVNLTTLDLTNLEVTNIKAKDGTAAMSIADSTGVASFTANPVLSGGTANGVTYLNGSKVLTSGSALTWDSTALTVGTNGLYLSGNTGGAAYMSTIAAGAATELILGASGNIPVRFIQSNTEAMRLTSSGLEIKQSQLIGYSSYAGIGSNGLAVNGSVGIGTASPGAKLAVSDGTRTAIINPRSSAAASGLAVGTDVASTGYVLNLAGDLNGGGTGGGVNIAYYSSASSTWNAALFLRNTASTYGNLLLMQDGGNVGIGTNAPGYKFQVVGGRSQLEVNAAGTQTVLTLNNSDTTAGTQAVKLGFTSSGVIKASINAAVYGNDYMTFNVGSDAERLRITSTGTLNIVGAGTAGSTQAVSFNGSAPQNSLVVDSSGQVGLGTALPSAKLDVAVARSATVTSASFGTTGTGSVNDQNRLLIKNVNTLSGQNYGVGIGGLLEASASNKASLLFYYDSGSASTEGLRLDSSGNLGLGVTPSAWGSGFKAFDIGSGSSIANLNSATETVLTSNSYRTASNWVYKFSQEAGYYRQASGAHQWFNAASGTANTTTITNGVSYTIITSGNQTAFGAANNNVGTSFTATSGGTLSSGTVSQNISFTQAMTLDASGNLYVGGTNGGERLNLENSGAASAGVRLAQTGSGGRTYVIGSTGSGYGSAGNLVFYDVTGSTERARITSGGYFKASDNGTYLGIADAFHELRSSTDNGTVIATTNASQTANSLQVEATRNTTNNTFYSISYYNRGAAAYKFRVADSGDVTNTNGTYGTISDQKHKTDIVDAGSQWSDIKALRFRKFKMKDDPSGLVQLGVVAQEVELTSPGLVDEHADRDAEGNDLGTTTKSVKTSILLMKAAVALQEAMARIEQLEAKVAALESN